MRAPIIAGALALLSTAAFATGPAAVKAIPGVVAEGAKIEVVAATLEGMDGIVGTADGGVIYAQEHTSRVRKVAADGADTVVASDTHGAGSLGMDRQGRIYAVERTCTDPGVKDDKPCNDPTKIGIVAPAPKVLADRLADGKPIPRPADLVVDDRGGAFVAARGVYHVAADGKVSTIEDQDIASNGIALSPDGRTLYVTNGKEIVAFDVKPDWTGSGRRVFSDLSGDANADGMAVDAAGRVYATGLKGVHVLAPDGKELGLIPTAHRPTSLAFGGAGRKTLFIVEVDAVGPDGQALAAQAAQPNGGRTLYRLPMLAAGLAGRPK
jgi:gluconolactonase